MPAATAESDLPDDLDAFAAALLAADDAEALASGGATADGVIGDVDPDTLDSSGRAVVVATEVLADFSQAVTALQRLGDIPLETPEQRELAVKLYNRLAPIETTVGLWRSMLESRFKAFLEREGADRATLPGGLFVSYAPPPAAWEVNGHDLRGELQPFVHDGTLTQQQVDDAVRVEIRYIADNTRLNTLAKHMGDRVAAVVERHRVKVPGSGRGKVTLPKEVK